MAIPTNPSNKKPPPPTAPKPKRQGKQQQPLEVYCRLRPLKAGTDEAALKQISNTQLQVAPQFGNGQQQIYQFKHVFQANTEQSVVFKTVGLPLVQDLISGQNGLLFTYGVTGAGKTFTITGKADQPGILPRLLDVLFNTLKNNNLQAMKYVFKPDNQNGFEIKPSPDALLQIQRENNVLSTPTNRQPHMTPRSVRDDIKTLERLQAKWGSRTREEGLIATINHDNNYAVFVSFVEVYNNYIYDLLDDSIEVNTPARSGMRSQQQPIMRASKTIREDANKRVYVLNVVEVEVKSADEAFDAFLKGVNRRKIGKTQMNAESSRSHSVFTIRLVQAPLDQNGTEILENKQYIHVSQLSIVDLAGCERTTKTQATGSRLKEASNINNSLMSLRNCFDILRENQKTSGKANKLVPYRDSKLTHLFKNYFEGEGAVKMVLCLNPGADDFNETQQVLIFGEQSQEITTNASRGIRFKHLAFDDDLCSPLTFGPPFPKRFLEDPSDETVIPEWITIAEKRKDAMQKAQENMLRRMSAIRQTISLIENERNNFKQQCETYKRDLDVRNDHVHRLEAKLREVTEARDGYNNMTEEQQQRIAQLESLLEQKEAECRELQTENHSLRTDLKDYMAKERVRMKKMCQDIMNSKQKELEQAKCLQMGKINLATQILLGNDNILSNLNNIMSPPESFLSNEADGQTRPKVLYDEQQVTTTITTVDRGNPNGPPVANPKFTSNLMEGAGKWIEHQPPGTLETGTVLQPQIKNSKSVTNLKPSDFKSGKYTKYAVTHHEATDSGNIQTQVFKGKVIPSSTGGAQVIFNDIETLQQDSPVVTTPVGIVSRKRQALEQMVAQSNSPSTCSSTNTPTSTRSDANVPK